MNVEELINILGDIEDKTLPIILQKDSEGNGYSPIAGVDKHCTYLAETTWYGVAYNMEDPDKDPDSKPCIVLYPIN